MSTEIIDNEFNGNEILFVSSNIEDCETQLLKTETEIIANTIEIDENGNVMVYDDRNEDENGIIEPIWFVKALDANLQNEVMFNLEYTLKNK